MAVAVDCVAETTVKEPVLQRPTKGRGPGSYVLVTPARNEADYIELTLKSVVQQTMPPLKWVVVSDGSTDATDEIVRRYAERYPWIELLRMPERTSRDFAGKVGCFNRGYERVQGLSFDFIGSLDADLSFDSEYFAFLISKLEADPKLGLVGTPFSEEGSTYNFKFASTEHVSGACQLFRRPCFEQIGGYIPIKGGGIDVAAVLSARVKGWKTRTFTEKHSIHHRPMGSAKHGRTWASYKLGETQYKLGFHPLWQLLRAAYQMSNRPYIVGGCALWLGYFSAMIRRIERPIPAELVEFQKRDQMRRLRALFRLG